MLEWNRACRAVRTGENAVVRHRNERRSTEYVRERIRAMMREQRTEYRLKQG